MNDGFGRWAPPHDRVVHAGHDFDNRARVAARRNRCTSRPALDHPAIGEQVTAVTEERNDGPEAPDVSRKGIILKALKDFRRHVDLRAAGRVGVVPALRVSGQKFCDPKICKLPDGATARTSLS